MSSETSIRLREGSDEYELHPQTIATIGEIAARNLLDIPTAIAQSIINEKFLMDLEADGYRLLIKHRRGSIRYLERI